MSAKEPLVSASNQSDGSQPVEETGFEDNEYAFVLHSVKNWWNSASLKACGKAERDLVDTFINSDTYVCQQRQIPIDYDPVPQSKKQKKSKWNVHCRSKSYNELPMNSKINDNDNGLESMKRAQTERFASAQSLHLDPSAMYNEGYNKRIYIHTLTIRVKNDRLKSLMKRVQSHSVNHNNDQNENEHDEDGNENGNDHDEDEDEDDTKDPNTSTTAMMDPGISMNYTSTLCKLKEEIHGITQLNQGIVGKKSIPPIVIGHGYGCGGAIAVPAVETIFESLLSGMTVDESPVIHIIDWLGNGMSSRPEFQCETTEEAEDWFVESLEAWRKAMDIEKMILCGHSLGGYASCVYTMRYPHHVDHWIGISPAGVDATKWTSSPNASWGAKTLYNLFAKLWDSGMTPHDLIRMAGPKGKGMVQKLVQRRLFRLDDENPLKALLAEYLYHVVAQPGSGEYALKLILQPGAQACHPLANRIGCLRQFQSAVKGYEDIKGMETEEMTAENLKEEEEEEEQEEKKNDDDDEEEEEEDEDESESESEIDADAALNDNLKIDFIYGETDWMQPQHAVKLQRESVIYCHVYRNRNCGHQLMLENSKGFGELLGWIIAKGQLNSQD